VHRQPQLSIIVDAIGPGRFILGLGQGGQQHGREDGDDGDDHQQFNEGKGAAAWARVLR